MSKRNRRRVGVLLIAAALVVFAITVPTGWGLGAVAAPVFGVCGWVFVTDRRPEPPRRRGFVRGV